MEQILYIGLGSPHAHRARNWECQQVSFCNNRLWGENYKNSRPHGSHIWVTLSSPHGLACTKTLISPDHSAAGSQDFGLISKVWTEEIHQEEWFRNPGLAFKSPIKAAGIFACDSTGPDSTMQGHSAASAPNTALELSVTSRHCLLCGHTHNKWGPAMSHFPGSIAIKSAWDAEQTQRRKSLLAPSAYIFWSRLKIYQLATFYSLQCHEENRGEAYSIYCCEHPLEQQQTTLVWDAMSFLTQQQYFFPSCFFLIVTVTNHLNNLTHSCQGAWASISFSSCVFGVKQISMPD